MVRKLYPLSWGIQRHNQRVTFYLGHLTRRHRAHIKKKTEKRHILDIHHGAGITNDALESIIRCSSVPNFIGVVSSDQLPMTCPKSQFCFVFNMSRKNTRGSHFVAVVVLENAVYYYDPFGMPPINAHFFAAVHQWSVQRHQTSMCCFVNKIRVQELHSGNCGLYCLHYLLSFCRNVQPECYFQGEAFFSRHLIMNLAHLNFTQKTLFTNEHMLVYNLNKMIGLPELPKLVCV